VQTLTTPPIQFETLQEGVLPASDQVGEDGERGIEIMVRALEAGSEGNVPAGAITAINGALGASLSIVNPSPLIGGTETTSPTATTGDRNELQESLLEELSEKCLIGILDSLPPTISDLPEILEVEIVDETYFPPEGQPGEAVSLTMELTCAGINYETVTQASQEMFLQENSTPDGYTWFDEAVVVEHSNIASIGSVTQWELIIERPLKAQIDPMTVVILAMGQTPNKAATRLQQNLLLDSAPVIILTPRWWPWMPVVPFRISIHENNN
jgi:hypothetical protein